MIFRNPCATASREIDNLLIEDASPENLPPAGICNEVEEEEEEDGGRKGKGGRVLRNRSAFRTPSSLSWQSLYVLRAKCS